MKMKMNWFSPLPPTQTAIGQYTANLMQHFYQNDVDVTIWTNQSEWSASIEPYANIQVCNKPNWTLFNQADVNIYHLANNVNFHGWIWEVSQLHPGIVVLHDQHLHHFFTGYYIKHLVNKNAYERALAKYYGDKTKGLVKKFCEGAISYEELNALYPITLHALENATGVIVHTEEAFKTLSDHQRLPVMKANLPYQPPTVEKIQRANQRHFKIIIFGYLGKNRRLESALKAFATFPKFQSFVLDIYGIVENQAYFEDLIKELNLHNHVRLHGFVDDETLNIALENADLAINLRFPSMGEASYSQLLMWGKSLPSMVTRLGWYATLPEEVVHFVRPEHEIEDIQQHLANFLDNPVAFKQKGMDGERFLKENHSIQAYVKSILEFIPHTLKFRSPRVGLSLTDKIRPLLPISNDALAQKVAEKIHKLFC